MFGRKKSRREKLQAKPFPASWLESLQRNVAVFGRLPEADRAELEGHIQVLLAEKNFEGAGGLQMTDEIRVTIAAQAAILLLRREAEYFPRLRSIVVYPGAFVVDHRQLVPEGGFIVEGPQTRLGESWEHGTVVLSWDDVRWGAADPDDGHNVVLHEFAHQLDREDGATDGVPLLDEDPARWVGMLRDELGQLRASIDGGEPTVLDDYGAEGPAEFFAVAVETFFERPRELRAQHPRLYAALRRFFNQDPAEWTTEPR